MNKRDLIERRLNEWSRWDSLRKLGSSPLVRSSLAFAAAGYLLLWNAKFQDFLTIKFDAHFSLWRIWMIYYGGICLAVATGLYSWFCPKPIKDHGSAFELAQSECQHLAIMGLGEKYLGDVKSLEARCTAAERALLPPDRPRDDFISHARKTRRAGSLSLANRLCMENPQHKTSVAETLDPVHLQSRVCVVGHSSRSDVLASHAFRCSPFLVNPHADDVTFARRRSGGGRRR